MPFWFAVLLGFGAVARVTRFINWDTLAQPLREWVMLKYGGTSKRYKLVTCCWCASIWIAAPAAVVVVLTACPWGGWPAVFTGLGLWLTYSWVYAVAAVNLDGGE